MTAASPAENSETDGRDTTTLPARLQERRLDDMLRSIGLTRTTWCVLLAVGNEALSQPSEIARYVEVDRTATSRALRQMEEAGVIERNAGEVDRRTTTVVLTRRGCERLRQGTPMAMRNNAIMEAKLRAADALELRRLLRRLTAGEDVSLARL